MDTYSTKQESTFIDGVEFKIKSLKDRTQFYDPEGIAESRGISSAMWPISGLLWPSSVLLARIVNQLALENLKILEVGCGLALASLVASFRGANITASDFHPLTESFLTDNIALNHLSHIKYFHGDWCKPITNKGQFDLIIGSDLLYDQASPPLLAQFINCHLAKNGRVILIDPGRKLANKFIKIMASLNIQCVIQLLPMENILGENVRCKSYTFTREIPGTL